jgi:hypothetical protein
MSDVTVEAPTEAPATPAKPKRKPAKKATSKPSKANGKPKAAKARATKGNRAPRTFDPAKLDAYGFRLGSIKSQAAALYKVGATLADVKEKLGSVQYNVLTELETKGFKINQKIVKGPNGRDVTIYKLMKGK